VIEIKLTFRGTEQMSEVLNLLATHPAFKQADANALLSAASPTPTAPAVTAPESTPAAVPTSAPSAPTQAVGAAIEPTQEMLRAAVRAYQKAKGAAATLEVLAPYRRASDVPASEYGAAIAKLAL